MGRPPRPWRTYGGHEEVRLFSKQGGALVAIRGLVSARSVALLGRFGVQ